MRLQTRSSWNRGRRRAIEAGCSIRRPTARRGRRAFIMSESAAAHCGVLLLERTGEKGKTVKWPCLYRDQDFQHAGLLGVFKRRGGVAEWERPVDEGPWIERSGGEKSDRRCKPAAARADERDLVNDQR